MPIEYEYEVVVSADTVKGTLKTADSVSEFEERIRNDDERRLRLDTIDVLRSWLNRWTALTRMSEYEHLTVLNTFTVLGRHLYATVFSGDVGNGLQTGREKATQARTTLRLLFVAPAGWSAAGFAAAAEGTDGLRTERADCESVDGRRTGAVASGSKPGMSTTSTLDRITAA